MSYFGERPCCLPLTPCPRHMTAGHHPILLPQGLVGARVRTRQDGRKLWGSHAHAQATPSLLGCMGPAAGQAQRLGGRPARGIFHGRPQVTLPCVTRLTAWSASCCSPVPVLVPSPPPAPRMGEPAEGAWGPLPPLCLPWSPAGSRGAPCGRGPEMLYPPTLSLLILWEGRCPALSLV